ncbi:retrovirus-related pol polyprotein line-1 [Plakobranchus ocellatus]|uniref:Retrovirus-related pol polyprotein line-1 n=1 Tax=Plakobranchus ocellatus TaxID=259542 RepID=A0AAV4B972_9GAST|nr:retrovirus-related pol polyprotein line-1 [Plakobranchus ocellatus]
MERCIERQKDLHLCFIDYSKAFDKVRHVELFRMLEKLDIDGKDLRVIRNLYWDQTASVRIEAEHSDFKPTKRGVKQGCVMSPDLFNLYSKIILRNLDGTSGLKINGGNLNNLRYADDTVLIAESGKQLQKLLDTAVLESERMGLSLNVKKTECMVISKKSSNPKCNLVSKGEKIKQVTKFKYLGYLITSDDRCTSEISKRIAMAKDTFQKMKPILANGNITKVLLRGISLPASHLVIDLNLTIHLPGMTSQKPDGEEVKYHGQDDSLYYPTNSSWRRIPETFGPLWEIPKSKSL